MPENHLRTVIGRTSAVALVVSLACWLAAVVTVANPDDGEHPARVAFLFGAANFSFTLGVLAAVVWVILAALGREHRMLLDEIRSLRRTVAELGAQPGREASPAAGLPASDWPLAPTSRPVSDAAMPPAAPPAATYHEVAERLARLVPGVPELATGTAAQSDRQLVETLLGYAGRAGLALPPDLTAQLKALDPSLMVVIARARVDG
ncbi:MAG: hypothetical protein CVT65_08995 [Actinobacteria bacterium HGW-Actinobacteria-5]|nr:MAG: hypothetical protein CVT65_08995 [Actinobacteria bacterium HGW-Actinobacteria-5]